MYDRPVLNLKEAQGAIRAMMEEVKGRKDYYWQHCTIAVVDFSGSLIALVRRDGGTQQGPFMAIRKAYTAATWALNSDDFGKFVVGSDFGGILSFGTEFTTHKGGVPILPPYVKKPKPGRPINNIPYVVGAIGVAVAGPGQVDEELATVGVKYLQKVLWPSKKPTSLSSKG